MVFVEEMSTRRRIVFQYRVIWVQCQLFNIQLGKIQPLRKYRNYIYH